MSFPMILAERKFPDSLSRRTIGFPVAKFIYARILFYEDNRNKFSWFLFAQFGMVTLIFEVVTGVNVSVHLLGF